MTQHHSNTSSTPDDADVHDVVARVLSRTGTALASTAAFEVYQYVYAGVGTISTLLWLASWAVLLFAIFTLAGELRAVVDASEGGDRPHG